MDANINAHDLWADAQKFYYLKAGLAQIRIHQLLLGMDCPASVEQVESLGIAGLDFEVLCSFEESLNKQREQSGEPIFALALTRTSAKCSLVHQEPVAEAESVP